MGRKEVIRKLKKAAALKKSQNPLLIKDSHGFGGFAVLIFMLFVMGVAIGVALTTVLESYQYGPEYLAGEKDIGALGSPHVTKLYNLFLYIASGFVGAAVAYLGFKYMWAAVKPEAAAQAKAVAPRLILAVCLLPLIGCLLKAVVWVNVEFIKVVVHQVGYGSVGALWATMVWNTAGQHAWTIYIPLIIMAFVIAFIVALFVRWFLLQISFLFTPLAAMLFCFDETRQIASKIFKVFFESVFVLPFWVIGMILIAKAPVPGQWTGAWVFSIASITFLLAIPMLFFNPINAAIGHAIGAGGAAAGGALLGGLRGRSAGVGGAFGGGVEAAGPGAAGGAGAARGIPRAGAGGAGAGGRFATLDAKAGQIGAALQRGMAAGPAGLLAAAGGMMAAGAWRGGARFKKALTKMGVREAIAGAPIKEALTRKAIKPSLATRIADKLEGKTPALAAPFRALGNKMDLRKLEAKHPRLGKWTRAEYNVNRLQAEKDGYINKQTKKAGITPGVQDMKWMQTQQNIGEKASKKYDPKLRKEIKNLSPRRAENLGYSTWRRN